MQPLQLRCRGSRGSPAHRPDLKWRKLQRAFHYNYKSACRSIRPHGKFQADPHQKKAQAFEGLGLIHQRRRVEETNWLEGAGSRNALINNRTHYASNITEANGALQEICCGTIEERLEKATRPKTFAFSLLIIWLINYSISERSSILRMLSRYLLDY